MYRLLMLISAAFIGYYLFNIATHPSSKIQNTLPHLKIKWVQLLPNVRIHIRGRIILLHHWINLSLILVITFVIGGGILDMAIPKGILLGGILNGFSYPDWKKILLKKKI